MFAKISTKKNVNRILSGICAFVMVCATFCGCNNSENSSLPSSNSSSSTQKGSSSFVASKTDVILSDKDTETDNTTPKPVSTAGSNSDTTVKTSSIRTESHTSSENTTLWTNSQTQSKPVVEPEFVDNGQTLLNGISQKQRLVIDKINSAILNFETVVEFDEKSVTSEDIADALTIISFINLDVTYVSTKYSVSVDDEDYVSELTLYYTKTEEQFASEKVQLEMAVKNIIDGCDATNDYEVVKYLHDSIVKACEYNFDGENMLSAYGCLVDGKAICEGYSKAFILLCSQYGIECMPVVGNCFSETGESEPHMWNLVKIDEKWYHIDLTWDDPVIKTEDNSLDDYICYEYFVLSDEEILKDHEMTQITGVEYPEAYDNSRNYFAENGVSFSTKDDAVKNLQRIINSAVASEEHYVRIKITDDAEFSEFQKYLFETYVGEKKVIFNVLNNALKQTQSIDFVAKRYSKLVSDENNILTLILNYE